MSVSIKIKLDDNKDDFELKVDKSATVADVIAAISARQQCANERITIRSEGVPLSRKSSIKELDINVALHASLGQPEVIIVAQDLPSFEERSRERASVTIDKKKNESPAVEIFESTVDRFPVGRWVETKIKNSLLSEGEDNDQWCIGKVIKDTRPGYILEIFESYKYFMPSKVQAADDEVRRAKRQSLRLIKLKSDEKTSDEEDSMFDLKTDSGADNPKVAGKGKKDARRKARRARTYEINVRRRARSRDFNRRVSADSHKKKASTPRWNRGRRATVVPSSSAPESVSSEDLSRAYHSIEKEYVKKFPDIEPSEIKTYIRLFRKELDIWKMGRITKEKLSKWIKENKINLKESSLDEMLKSLDIQDGRVNMENFIDIMCSAKVGTKGRELRELFKSFDTDGNGAISIEELRLGMKKLFKQDIPDDRLEQMVKEADSTGTGEICFKDFKRMMLK